MNQDLIQALKELEREKGIPFETILAGLEEALASAFKTFKRSHDPEMDEEATGARVQLDPESGAMRAWLQELDIDINVNSHLASSPGERQCSQDVGCSQ